MKAFSRTAIFNFVKLLAGVLALFGAVIDVELVTNHIEAISASAVALYVIFDGVAGVLLRKLTVTRLVPGSLIKKV